MAVEEVDSHAVLAAVKRSLLPVHTSLDPDTYIVESLHACSLDDQTRSRKSNKDIA